MESLEARAPRSIREGLRDYRREESDWQLALSGLCELTAARYEILCGRQGAHGYADPALLASIVNSSAGLSRIGREAAFQLQQTQEIRSAARVAGSLRKSTGPRCSSRPSGSAVGGGASSASSLGCRGGINGGGGGRSGRGGRGGAAGGAGGGSA
jgi:hypothetical protein